MELQVALAGANAHEKSERVRFGGPSKLEVFFKKKKKK